MISLPVYLSIASILFNLVSSHGYMLVPPGRASMWREGWPTPRDYSDNQMFCGGFQHQWELNDGKCGVCGDPYDGERKHEAGTDFATGTIVRHYKMAEVINVSVIVTANHFGYFKFSLCKVDNYHTKATQECMSRTRLHLADGGVRYMVNTSRVGTYNVLLRLPPSLTCDQCVLQWKYHAGNSWGVGANGRGCVGCGPQEEFYACADVKISQQGGHVMLPTTTTIPPSQEPVDPDAQLHICNGGLYKATTLYHIHEVKVTKWCMVMCNILRSDRNCPLTHCQCA